MRIDEIRCDTRNDRTRLSASLVWEDCDGTTDVLWYEWPSSFAEEVTAAAAAILCAALPLALVNGERRIAMAEPVCAFLYDHLRNVLGLFCAWHPQLSAPALAVEREAGSRAPPEGRCAAICLSGGVDSLAALLENQTALAPGHPERIRDGIFVFGLNTYDFERGTSVPAREAWYRDYAGRLRSFCDEKGLSLIPVATNVRSLYADWTTWWKFGPASALAPVGHAMCQRIHALTIAGGGAGADGSVSGTEPSLDPLFSSYSLDVRTVHGTVSRTEKLRLIARDPHALAVLRVCLTMNVPPTGSRPVNCGRCEKCIRTMLALLVCDALDRAPTFPSGDVAPEMLADLQIDPSARRQLAFYRTMLDPLRRRGRGDLARALERRLGELAPTLTPEPTSILQRLRGR